MSPGISTRLLATQSDERLLGLVRDGHERAFEALVHRYRKQLLGYCRRLRLGDARAEDIVQLALLKTWVAVREGAEVRELKPWLYRVVHNTAVNAMRDSAHDGEPLGNPLSELLPDGPGAGLGARALHASSDDTQLDRGLEMREALAEVAALPPLQREVIVRTAVAGHSHEQVASDLGITNGAVRGLLYRARTTLRAGVTALTPPPLLSWLVGRSDAGAPAPQQITELAAGTGAGAGMGGAAGVSGLLLKGGVVAVTAGTVITGAVVHLAASHPHHHHRDRLVAVAPGPSRANSGAAGESTAGGARPDSLVLAGGHGGAGAHHGRGHGAGGGGSTRTHGRTQGTSRGAPGSAGAGSPGAVTHTLHTHAHSPTGARPGQGTPATPGDGGQPSQTPPGASQPSGSSDTSSSPSGDGSGGATGQSGGGGGAGSGSGSESGAGSGSGSESGSESQSGSSGTSGTEGSQPSSSESSGSESSGEQPASLVGTVVHEVGSVLEHLLH